MISGIFDKEKMADEAKRLCQIIDILDYIEGKKEHCFDLTMIETQNKQLCEDTHFRLIRLKRRING